MKAGPLPFSLQETDRIVQAGIVGQAGAEAEHEEGQGKDPLPAEEINQQQPDSGQQLSSQEIEFVEVPAVAPPEKKETEELGQADAAHEQPDGVGAHRHLPGKFRELVPGIPQNKKRSKVGYPDGIEEIPPKL